MKSGRTCCICGGGGFYPSGKRLVHLSPGTVGNPGPNYVDVHQADCYRQLIGATPGDRGFDWLLRELR